jgi:hypothetical protein
MWLDWNILHTGDRSTFVPPRQWHKGGLHKNTYLFTKSALFMERFPGHQRQCLLLGRKSDPDPTSHKVPARITKYENKIINKLFNWDFYCPGFCQKEWRHIPWIHISCHQRLYASTVAMSHHHNTIHLQIMGKTSAQTPFQYKNMSVHNNHHSKVWYIQTVWISLLTHLKTSHSELYSSAGTMVLPLDT